MLEPVTANEPLFYQLLQEQLLSQYNVHSAVQLYNYQRFAALPGIVSAIDFDAAHKHLLIIQIRPSLLFHACSLFSNKRPHYVASENFCSTKNEVESSWWKQWLSTANSIAGTLSGQHNKAIIRINTHITSCVHWCLQHNVLPIILGPVHSKLSPVHRLYGNSINEALHKAVDSTGGIYIDAYALLLQEKKHLPNYFAASGLQLNPEGHEALANYMLAVAGQSIARHSKQLSFTNHGLTF